MTKRAIQDYAEVGMGGLEQLISETDVDNFKTQDRTRVGYYGDLPIVAENAAYLESPSRQTRSSTTRSQSAADFRTSPGKRS